MNRLSRRPTLVWVLASLLGFWLPIDPKLGAQSQDRVSFNRDVLPILSRNCFKCHGPDANARKAELRIDTREGLLAPRKNGPAVVPGKPELSAMIRQVTRADPNKRMPPAESGKTLSAQQIKVLRQWIAEGAGVQTHWAFTKPPHQTPPKTENSDWSINAIDNFVLARLSRERIQPAPTADKHRLLRRVTLDLTGLPPTPSELGAFAADESPDAYEKVVDRLLARPSYGERMAWDWLDAARYADTNGYQGDRTRTMWPYRDWVVNALNDNLPYDQFLIWQLAGDLLPESTPEQRIATGFCRNHMINGEGGRIAEENRVEYIFDQIETVGTVFLGLTMTCARCHDHKFDPISQRSYYELFAYFNQTPVTGEGGDPQTAPVEIIQTEADRAQLAALTSQIELIKRVGLDRRHAILAGQKAWEASVEPSAWRALSPLHAHSREGQSMAIQDDRTILVGGKNPANDTYTLGLKLPSGSYSGLRLESLLDKTMTEGGLSRSNSGNFVLTGIEVAVQSNDVGKSQPIEVDSAVASYEQGGFSVLSAIDGKRNTGWAVHEGKFVDRAHSAVFRFAEPITNDSTQTLLVTLRHDSRYANHNLGLFRLSVTENPRPELDHRDTGLDLLLQKHAESRTPAEAKRVEAAYLNSDSEYAEAERKRRALRAQLKQLKKASRKVKVMVMADRPGEARKSYILGRGLYSDRRSEVTASVPQFLLPLPTQAPKNRLSLARWLVNPNHPLTARVVANRHWQKFFGTGLVKTAEDFGTQGERPSHPQLLSWLADEFVRSGWDVKALHRSIVTSATYRQSAQAIESQITNDPENRLLARGPRQRLPSWMIRDLALATSDLLVTKRGGPSVMTYQPAGLWADATFGLFKYKQGRGESLYRRSLYTFWRRIIGPAIFFDTAKRQTCSVAASQTNTPLHALTTLNSTAYVEAARCLAENLLHDGSRNTRAKLTHAFELVTSRRPKGEEIDLLLRRLALLEQEYREHPDAAQLLLAIGKSARDPTLDPVRHAAWTGLCSLILNLDEALSK